MNPEDIIAFENGEKMVVEAKKKTFERIILPYHDFSNGARELSKALGVTRIQRQRTPMDSLKDVKVCINWGITATPKYFKADKILNPFKQAGICSNKVKFFEFLADKDVRIPTWTNDLETALAWAEKGEVVMGRSATGSCGSDITFYGDDTEKFNGSDFWVQYKKKKYEFRIHLVKNGDEIGMFLSQKKTARSTDDEGNPIDTKDLDWRIRNHANGFIFARQGFTVPEDCIVQAKAAFKAVDLDFGAVDVIYNEHERRAYVLEINTAPGLDGSTVDDYKAALEPLLAA